MLILTRKAGQSFLIGPDVEITITEISGDKVRVGIEAPKEVKVLRAELRDTAAVNRQSAGTSTDALRALAKGLKAKMPAETKVLKDEKSENKQKPE